jgi:hypothetical protein
LLEGGAPVPTPQTIYAFALCAAGAFVLTVSHYQVGRREIGKVWLISPRAKHLLGLVCIIIGFVFFAGQYIHLRHR